MQSRIEGIVIRGLSRHEDSRGWLLELFRQDELSEEFHPVMGYISSTRPGVTRGPHEHRQQTDVFCFTGSAPFRLYLWDNRPDSSTHGAHERLEIPAGAYVSLIVPAGVVHAYRNVGPTDGLVFNFPNRLYAGQKRREEVDEIRHEDDPNSPFRIDD
jgi:dTDP-4-dehydrorhamnose 3,5-epimerase